MVLRNLLKPLIPRKVRDWLRGRRQLWLLNFRWRLRWLAGRCPPPKAADGTVRLHLGCGAISEPGFTNIDAMGFAHVHHLGPIHPLPAFKGNSVDLIYVSHCLEHLEIVEVPKALAEWFRVLKPGGLLRIAVPDFDAIMRMYECSGGSIPAIQYVLLGGQDYLFNFHKSVFNESHLRGLLAAAGFAGICKWEDSTFEQTGIKDCSTIVCRAGQTDIAVSLNMEGCKPLDAVSPNTANRHTAGTSASATPLADLAA